MLTGREGREGEGGRGGVAATAVQSHSTSPPSGAGQIYSFCSSGEHTAIARRNEVTPAWLAQ